MKAFNERVFISGLKNAFRLQDRERKGSREMNVEGIYAGFYYFLGPAVFFLVSSELEAESSDKKLGLGSKFYSNERRDRLFDP